MAAPALKMGHEVFFDKADIIVSKTDLTGRITYVNDVFCHIADYKESEVVGQQHSIIRHPDMPRAVFKLLWDTLATGREIFAYVKNMTKYGNYYWVLAHVTPSYDGSRNIIGYHSNRRVPDPRIIQSIIAPLYSAIAQEESRHRNGKEALAAGYRHLTQFIDSKGLSYDELILSL